MNQEQKTKCLLIKIVFVTLKIWWAGNKLPAPRERGAGLLCTNSFATTTNWVIIIRTTGKALTLDLKMIRADL